MLPIACLLIIAAAVFAAAAGKIVFDRGTSYEWSPSRAWALVPAGLGILALVFASTAVVEAKNVGVVTEFGRPVGTASPGLNFKLPWQKVTEVDGTVQTDEYKGDDRCIYVRIGDGSRACVTLTNRWKIVDDQADQIYGDYRSDDPTKSLRDAVVSTQLKAATQEVFAKYNPIAELEVVEGSNAKSASELSFAPDYDAFSRAIQEAMEGRQGAELIEIKSITVSYVSLSESTQRTIDGFIKAVGETRIAAQDRSTALEQAKANEALSASVSNAPGVLQSRCLDAVLTAIEKGYQLPAGFNCLGSGSAVVVPSAR